MAEARTGRAAIGMPALRLGAYEGPLDLLLDLARTQRVDLAAISILRLADQFAEAVQGAIARGGVPLATLGDWLVTATSLLLLRSRLLLPAGSPEHGEAEREAATLRNRLAERAAMGMLATWLEQQPQLGREVFGRAAPLPTGAGPPSADVTDLLRACLRLLVLPADERIYRPALPVLWRVPDARPHMRRLMAKAPDGGLPLTALAPDFPGQPRRALQRRAALASTLMAGLELSREGVLTLDQQVECGEIRVRARVVTA